MRNGNSWCNDGHGHTINLSSYPSLNNRPSFFALQMQVKSLLFVSTTLLASCVNGFCILPSPAFRGLSDAASLKVVMFVSSDKLTEKTVESDKVSKEDPIECYLVNEDDVVEDRVKPKVVCTSDPDEYAWMEGLNRRDMIKTDGMENLTGQCIEGASPTGKEEWECEE